MKNIKLYQAGDETIAIQQGENGRYYNKYNYNIKNNNAAYSAGWFTTLKEAERMLKRHRPSANEIKYILTFKNENNGIKETFNTAKEANEKALYYWNHLTQKEKKENQIYVEKIDKTCLTKEAIDEDKNTNWTLTENTLYTNEELFDSEEIN